MSGGPEVPKTEEELLYESDKTMIDNLTTQLEYTEFINYPEVKTQFEKYSKTPGGIYGELRTGLDLYKVQMVKGPTLTIGSERPNVECFQADKEEKAHGCQFSIIPDNYVITCRFNHGYPHGRWLKIFKNGTVEIK